MAATFVVETGTGLADANSFQSVAGADQYNDDHNQDTAWTNANQATKEKHLRLATQYLTATYDLQWKGRRVTYTQKLSWPRYDVWFDDYLQSYSSMPQQLLDATSELAIRSNNGTNLLPDISAANSGDLIDDRVVIGPLEFEQKYSSAPQNYDTFTVVSRMLAPLLSGAYSLTRG